MKPLVLALLLLFTLPQDDTLRQKIRTFRNSSRFSVRYDKFRGDTSVTVGPFFVGGTSAYVISGFQLEMSASFIKDNRPLKMVYLLFRAKGKDWTFLKTRDLYALADGERMSFGEGDWDGDVRRSSTSELLIFAVPVEEFNKIANAQSAELKIGRLELKLKDEHKEAFRDLLSLTK